MLKKLKIKRKGFGFEIVLEGAIKIDQSKIKPYDDYYKEEEEKLICSQVYDYLLSIVPMAQDPKPGESDYSLWNYRHGAQCGLRELANHLAKNVERENV
jgi:hypothetical protein